MKRSMKNTVSVLIATMLTALAIFSAVTFTNALVGSGQSGTASVASANGIAASYAGSGSTAANSSGTLQYCPRTGCSATSCHATQGR